MAYALSITPRAVTFIVTTALYSTSPTLAMYVCICQTCNNAGLRVISITCSLLIRPWPTARPRPRCLLDSFKQSMLHRFSLLARCGLKAAITLEHHRCWYICTDI